MKRVSIGILAVRLSSLASAASIDCGMTNVLIDEATGRIALLQSVAGTHISEGFETRYFAMSKNGDVDAFERDDVLVEALRSDDGSIRYRCSNPRLPGISITKTYRASNGGLRRTLEFRGDATNSATVYVTPFVRCTFADGFKKGLWHLGAGYIGPYRPYPNVKKPQTVNQYKQSSKGLVFTHPNGKDGDFAHYRVKIDDTVVLPWFHSTIGHYREYHDRLWYLPDGYEMGLGTFDVRPERTVSVTDHFTAFDGAVFGFFDKVFSKDEDIRREIDSIPHAPEWIQNLACIFWNTINDDFVRWMGEMMDTSEFIATPCLFNSWGDYRFDPETGRLQGNFGGNLTLNETRAYYDRIKSFSGRVHVNCYQIVISAGKWTRILKEHPEWFRMRDRDGNEDSLFPNFCHNFQTKFSNASCRTWMADMIASFAKITGADIAYTDETQMTNTIDWDTDEITRDDDSVKFWRILKRRLNEDGVMYFANGSGIPYADLNYMESPHEMQPCRWRDWVGVALGIGMFNRMKPGNRTSPLYWIQSCDYVNRFLALGWVPVPAPGEDRLMPIRAAWQCGHMDPINVSYDPDWKKDFTTDVESHASIRRNSHDIIMSFINRGTEKDVPVSIDLSTVGFDSGTQINIWKGHFDEARAVNGPILSDSELRAGWRGEGSIDGTSLYSPELVYSGNADGVFADVIPKLGKDKMEQYLITTAPLQFFAVNDIPLNQYYTTAKGCSIIGRTIRNNVRTDVILADVRHGFSDITANGTPICSRRIRLGERIFDIVTLEPGSWEIGWNVAAYAYGADAIADLPAKAKARSSSVSPVRKVIDPGFRKTISCSRHMGTVTIDEAYCWASACETKTGIQPDIRPGIADADVDALHLSVGASRRESVNTTTLRCWAGFRINGAKKLKLRFRHTLQDVHSSHRGYTYPWGWGKPPELFTGFVVDYHTPTGYTKRVSMSTGLFSEKCVAVFPWWGVAKGAKESINLSFGEWIEDAAPHEFVLDLARFAPDGWDGKIIFSLGEEKLGTGRRLEADIVAFNDVAIGNEKIPRAADNIRDVPPPVNSKPVKSKPCSLVKLHSEEWDNWAKLPGKFTRLVQGVAKKGTTAYIAHDYEYMYVGVKCEEDDRGPSAGASAPYQNEHIEICFHRSDGKVVQFMGDVKGRAAYFIERTENSLPKGFVCRGENCKEWHAGWRVFFAIPLDSLKVDMQRTPVVIRANVCRVRKIGEPELTSWSPMEEHGFYDLPKYGTWVLDFNW